MNLLDTAGWPVASLRLEEGALPREMESALPVDSYRVFRCLAHWVEEGALRTRAPAA